MSKCRRGWIVWMSIASRWVVLTLVCLLPAAAASGASRGALAPNDAGVGVAELERILQAFDAAQRRTGTMTARFTEEKRLRLLAAPVVSHGEFSFSRPNRVRWEFRDPEPKVFIITEGMYVAYYPGLRRAEEVPFSQFVGKRLFRFIGVGQSIADLGKYYDFSLKPPSDLEGTHLLVLTPRRKGLQERIAELRIWVDDDTSLPRRIAYVEAEGDSTVITFQDVRANVDIAETRFRIALPSDVIVSDQFNGFALGGR